MSDLVGKIRLKSGRAEVRSDEDRRRMFDYWRATFAELVALAPKTPFIGPKGED